MTSANFIYCGDDEEILNALYAADSIASELKSSSKSTKSQYLSVPDSGMVSWSSVPKFQLNDDTIRNECSIYEVDTTEIDTFHEDPVYQVLMKSIHSIQVMCDLCDEKNKNVKVACDELMKQNADASELVMSTQVLGQNLVKITTTFDHMLCISKQCSHLKQVLRNGLSQQGLIVNPSNQESVIKFFILAKEMMDNFREDIKSIKACLTTTNKQKKLNVQIQLQINEILKRVARRIDNMVELQSILKTLKPDLTLEKMGNSAPHEDTSHQPVSNSSDSDLLFKL